MSVDAASSPLQKKDSTPKWAGGGLPPMPEDPAVRSTPTPSPTPSPAPADRQAMLDDPKLNDILDAIPGATVWASQTKFGHSFCCQINFAI